MASAAALSRPHRPKPANGRLSSLLLPFSPSGGRRSAAKAVIRAAVSPLKGSASVVFHRQVRCTRWARWLRPVFRLESAKERISLSDKRNFRRTRPHVLAVRCWGLILWLIVALLSLSRFASR
jgi:hypothetical protein